MDLDDEVCLCFRVSQRKLLQYIKIYAPRVASQLSECGGAGTGCGWCVPFLKKLFAQQQALLDLSSEEYAQNRLRYHEESGKKPPVLDE